MAYVGKVKIDNGAAVSVASTLYGTCSTSGIDIVKNVTCDDFNALIVGVTIYVKFSYTNVVSGPTLKVNGTAAKPIALSGGRSGVYAWKDGDIKSFTYDGTSWVMHDEGQGRIYLAYFDPDARPGVTPAVSDWKANSSYGAPVTGDVVLLTSAWANCVVELPTSSSYTLNINDSGAYTISCGTGALPVRYFHGGDGYGIYPLYFTGTDFMPIRGWEPMSSQYNLIYQDITGTVANGSSSSASSITLTAAAGQHLAESAMFTVAAPSTASYSSSNPTDFGNQLTFYSTSDSSGTVFSGVWYSTYKFYSEFGYFATITVTSTAATLQILRGPHQSASIFIPAAGTTAHIRYYRKIG